MILCRPVKKRAILIRLGAAIGKKEGIDVSRRDLRQLCAQARARLGRHKWVGIAELLRLFVDSLNHALVAVPDIHRHQLAVEIDEPLPFRRP